MASRISSEQMKQDRPAEFEFEQAQGWSEEDEWENGTVQAVLYTQPWWRSQPRLSVSQAAS